MKKGKVFFILVGMLTILTACSADKGESAQRAETGISENTAETEETDLGTAADNKTETGTAEADSETETQGDVAAGTAGQNPGTAEIGEDASFPERAYEPDIIYYDEASNGLHLRKDVEKTRTDYAVYYFEPSVSGQERNACIEATDRMLSCMDAQLPDIEVVVLQQESYDGVSVSGNRLYLSPQPWDSVDYLAKVLLAGYGEWGNYGLAYGYADYLCNKAEEDSGESDSGARKTGGFRTVSAPELYDLNLLCFDERFASPKDVEAAKANARLFAEDYLSSHSEEELLELLSASGTTEGVARANEALEAFYAENSVDCSLTEILYQCGGATADYAASCEYASFYIYKDWQDMFWERIPMISENFLHEDYREVREFFECNARQMQQYQESFGFDSYNNDLSVYLKNHNRESAYSYYLAVKHTIDLESVISLMHEYIHSLMNRYGDWNSDWKVEGFARYFSYKYDRYLTDYLNYEYNRSDDSDESAQEYIIVGQEDFIRWDNIHVHERGETDPNTSYESGSSFIGYLVDQYGEQAVIAYVCSKDEYNADWDKSYDELARDWRAYIRKNYAQ